MGPIYSNYNGTGTTASSTFTASTSGTVSATVSGSTNIGLSAKVASVATTYGISATVSMSVTLGNSITINIPPGTTGNGKYGAWRAYVTGTEKYYTTNCVVTQTASTTTYSPYKRGWVTWIS